MNRPSGSGKVLFIVYMVTLQNGSGVDKERQVERHHRLALVTLPLDAAVRCVHSLSAHVI